MTENDVETARCPDCHMPLTMHHDPGCSHPCGRCADVEHVTPNTGCIVHYVGYGTPGGEYGKECRAAIITEVEGRAVRPPTMEETDSWVVGLCVLNPTGQFFNRGVVQMEDASHDGGTWHWPERA